MPGDRGSAEPARYALLGLLLSGPSHGYDLARQFAPPAPLAEIIHLSPSHLYALLNRLERNGLISGRAQEAGNRPTRRVYRLTETGHASLLLWVEQPVGHPRDMRIEFPLKLYVMRSLPRSQGIDLIERQRHLFSQYIDTLEQRPITGESPGDLALAQGMRAGRIGRAQAAIDWLDQWAGVLLGDGQPQDQGWRLSNPE